jgi:hypothetical protein
MTFRGQVKNGVVLLQNAARLPEGTWVEVTPLENNAGSASNPLASPVAVSKEQREALLGLIGMCKTDNPPNDEEVEQIIEEARMQKYG